MDKALKLRYESLLFYVLYPDFFQNFMESQIKGNRDLVMIIRAKRTMVIKPDIFMICR